MRFKTFFTLFFFIMTFPLFGQFTKGSVEMALSGQASIIKSKTEVADNNKNFHESATTDRILFLYLQPSYYFINRVAFEPEIILMDEKDEKMALGLTANLTYHFTNGKSNCIPFVLMGYGVCNSVPFNRTLLTKMSDKMDIHLFNAGAGLKVMMGEKAAFRVEYRYQHYSWNSKAEIFNQSENSMSTVDSKSHKYFNNILFGLTVFLKRAP